MILLIRTNETAGNIAVFYYGGHGFCKKVDFGAHTASASRCVCDVLRQRFLRVVWRAGRWFVVK